LLVHVDIRLDEKIERLEAIKMVDRVVFLMLRPHVPKNPL